jgi:hypothetical protein
MQTESHRLLRTACTSRRSIALKSLYIRSALSALVLLLVTMLAWNATLSGEAVTGIFGTFSGYLWAQRRVSHQK